MSADEFNNDDDLGMEDFGSDGDDGETWLLSYADLMTLLASFFILMMAFANFDPVQFGEDAETVSKSFKKVKQQSSKDLLKQLKDEIENHTELKEMTGVEIDNETLTIDFRGNVLITSGETKLTEGTAALIDSLVELIMGKNPDYKIIIEGHTDDSPVSNRKLYSSNWAVSSLRAASVLERFQYYGFDPQNLKLLGLGESSPEYPNRDENGQPIPENQALNRRVIIKVLTPRKDRDKVKLGFGAYFSK